MIVKVRMLAFEKPLPDGSPKIREVNIPDDEWESNDHMTTRLDLVFHYGQNDFQPQQCCSVSVGDVIEHNGLHMVQAVGFHKLSQQEYDTYAAMDHRDRLFCELVAGTR